MWDDRDVEIVSCVRDSRDECAYDSREDQELAHRRICETRSYHLRFGLINLSIVGIRGGICVGCLTTCGSRS